MPFYENINELTFPLNQSPHFSIASKSLMPNLRSSKLQKKRKTKRNFFFVFQVSFHKILGKKHNKFLLVVQ